MFVSFQRSFFLVYFLALLGDWLQGPYVYKLYAYYGFKASQFFPQFYDNSLVFILIYHRLFVTGVSNCHPLCGRVCLQRPLRYLHRASRWHFWQEVGLLFYSTSFFANIAYRQVSWPTLYGNIFKVICIEKTWRYSLSSNYLKFNLHVYYQMFFHSFLKSSFRRCFSQNGFVCAGKWPLPSRWSTPSVAWPRCRPTSLGCSLVGSLAEWQHPCYSPPSSPGKIKFTGKHFNVTGNKSLSLCNKWAVFIFYIIRKPCLFPWLIFIVNSSQQKEKFFGRTIPLTYC